jgi:hypothetical protein
VTSKDIISASMHDDDDVNMSTMLPFAIMLMDIASNANFVSFNEGVMSLMRQIGTPSDYKIASSKESDEIKYDLSNDPAPYLIMLANLCPRLFSIGINLFVLISIQCDEHINFIVKNLNYNVFV